MSRKAYLKTLIENDDEVNTADLPRGVTYKIVSSKKRTGVKVSFTQASIKNANIAGRKLGQSPKKPLFTIRLDAKKRINFTYTIAGTDAATPTADAEVGLMDEAMTPTYTVKAAFPGKVLTTTGKVKGRTVTWKGKYAIKAKKLKATSKRR
jgi:hypothetical protein